MSKRIAGLVLLIVLAGSAVLAQNPPARTPTETTRLFYQMLREKKFREAFVLSIYRSAIESMSQQEFADLRLDFEKTAQAVSEKIPDKIDVYAEQISGDVATVFVIELDPHGKEKVEPAALIKVDNA